VHTVVEAPVRDRQQAKARERHGAAWLPESAAPELGTNGSGQGADRRMKCRDAERKERNDGDAGHCAVQCDKQGTNSALNNSQRLLVWSLSGQLVLLILQTSNCGPVGSSYRGHRVIGCVVVYGAGTATIICGVKIGSRVILQKDARMDCTASPGPLTP
jgi:hypothetical protein